MISKTHVGWFFISVAALIVGMRLSKDEVRIVERPVEVVVTKEVLIDRPPSQSSPAIHVSESESGGFRFADTLRNRGKQDVGSTLESMYWAINAGEAMSLAALIEIPEAAHEAAKHFYDRLPVESRANHSIQEILGLWLTAGIEPISGFEIISMVEGADIEAFDAALKANPSYRTVRLRVQWDGRRNEQRFVFHNAGQGWHWVLTPDLVSRVARFASSYRPVPQP
jgi:hypothetical protein